MGDQARTAAATTNGLTAAAVGAGVVGVTVLVVSAGVASDRAGLTAWVVLPTPGGVALAIGGRW